MIENMTLRVPRLGDAVAAYEALGYGTAATNVTQAAAIALSDPALEGCAHHCILMSAEPLQTLTLVEWTGALPTPFATPGWSAMEVLVKDLDALHKVLPAGFTVLNPPAALSFSDQIRAMQVAGPAAELIYFTEVAGEVPGFELPSATHQVNQCFVMINAVTRIERSVAFYAHLLNCEPPTPMPARVSILSRTNGLDEDYRHDIAPIELGPGQLFELDQWVERPISPPESLPCGWHSLSLRRETPPPVGIPAERQQVDDSTECFHISCPDHEHIEWLCPAT
ncbi:MAG: hypothetical protein P8M73_13135 [Luminiphilus sp.]|jgi:hypothetical protein|nr:hypothetical protein [Luminiphilus sp.]